MEDTNLTTPIIQIPKSNWLLFLLVGTVILAVGIVLGLFVGKYIYTPKSTPSPIIFASPSPVPISDLTVNWKTYTTQKFNLKYPADWQVGLFQHVLDNYTFQPTKTFVPESEKNSIVISISGHCLNTQCLTVFNLEQMINQINAKIVSQTQVNEVTAYKVSLSDGKMAYVFINEEDFFTISTDNYLTELDQILSTFRFLDKLPEKAEGSFCGGFAGVICPDGYNCKYDDNYPDASGICIKN